MGCGFCEVVAWRGGGGGADAGFPRAMLPEGGGGALARSMIGEPPLKGSATTVTRPFRRSSQVVLNLVTCSLALRIAMMAMFSLSDCVWPRSLISRSRF